MRRSIRRSATAALALGAATAVSALMPGTAQAAEYYELAGQSLGASFCPGANQSLTVWKKGVQDNQIWSHTNSGGIGSNKCQKGTTLVQALYLVTDQGTVAQAYGAVADTVTTDNSPYTTQVEQNVSYSLPVGWAFHLHSYACSPQGECGKLHVSVVKRVGPGTESTDWQVLTQVV